MVFALFSQILKLILWKVRMYQIRRLCQQGLTLGENVSIQQGVILDPSHCWHITIGDNVSLAPNVHILAHDGSTRKHTGLTKIGKVTVGNNVFIGASAIVLPGVTIGENSVIGAGSVVTKDVPPNVVASGNPLKVLGCINDFNEKHRSMQQALPVFGEEYTIARGINLEMKAEMNQMLSDSRFAYLP